MAWRDEYSNQNSVLQCWMATTVAAARRLEWFWLVVIGQVKAAGQGCFRSGRCCDCDAMLKMTEWCGETAKGWNESRWRSWFSVFPRLGFSFFSGFVSRCVCECARANHLG